MNVIIFDLETQYLFKELGMLDFNSRDPTKLKLSVAGILTNGKSLFFNENQIAELMEYLKKADLIVGHNLLRFDYLVLQPYVDEDVIKLLANKTFDMMLELEKTTGCWIPLDDLGKRNIGMIKNMDTLKIPKMWREGKHEEVKNYLINDLKMTEAIFNHGKQAGKFKYEHKEYGESLGEKEVIVKW